MTVEYKLKEEREYPYVGVFKDEEDETIVFFIAPGEGVCLSSTDTLNTDPYTGYTYGWDERLFKVCEEITIKM